MRITWRVEIKIQSGCKSYIQEELVNRDEIVEDNGKSYLISKSFEKYALPLNVMNEATKKIAKYNAIIKLKHGMQHAMEFTAVYHSTDGFISWSITVYPETGNTIASGEPPSVDDGTRIKEEYKEMKIYDVIQEQPIVYKVIALINTEDATYASIRKAMECMFRSDSKLKEKYELQNDYRDFVAFINYEELSGNKGIHTHEPNRTPNRKFSEQEVNEYIKSMFYEWYSSIEEKMRKKELGTNF